MATPDPRWSLHPTPKANEMGFSVVVPADEVGLRIADLEAFVEGSQFKNFPWIPDPELSQDGAFGLYQYIFNRPVDAGNIRFHFARNKTDAEKNTPFKTWWKKLGNHRWCPLLKGLAFIQDYSFPLATTIIRDGEQGVATAPKSYVREIYINEVNEGSRFLLDELISPTPYAIARTPVPQPGRVNYQINGISGSFEDCLHDDIEIPNTPSATATYYGGTEGSADGKVPGQFFPRTNFRRRRPYVLAVDQELTDGGYYMQRLRVFPPRQPRTTVQ